MQQRRVQLLRARSTEAAQITKFVAQEWLDEVSADSICHTFELGGSIAALGEVAFVRDGITVSLARRSGKGKIVCCSVG